MKKRKDILVAGVGNIFHGDDAFGVRVARELQERTLPEGVHVLELGIRSYDLAFAILDGYEIVILVDAAARGREPGTLYLIDLREESPDWTLADGHSMSVTAVLALVRSLGGFGGAIFLVGCEPGTLVSLDMALSPAVEESVPAAIAMIERLVGDLTCSETLSGISAGDPAEPNHDNRG